MSNWKEIPNTAEAMEDKAESARGLACFRDTPGRRAGAITGKPGKSHAIHDSALEKARNT